MTKVGVFDSGCGGLSIIKQLLSNNLNYQLYYYGDSLNNPWGDKSKDDLLDILTKISEWFNEQEVDIIISGCHTVYSFFKDDLSNIFNKPVLNLISGTEKFYSQDNYTALMTENSYNVNLFHSFLNHSSDRNIQEIACPALATLIEKNNLKDTIESISQYLSQAKYSKVILGCTHYSLIINDLQKHFKDFIFIDPIQYFIQLNSLPKSNRNDYLLTFKISGSQLQFNRILQQHLPIKHYILNDVVFDIESIHA